MPRGAGPTPLAPADVAPLPPPGGIEASKREAARRCVDDHVRSGMRVGVGSGSTIVYAIQRLAELHRDGALALAACVPTSFQSRNLLVASGLPVVELTACPVLDLAIDGADEVAPTLALIKGGGACHTQEKLVAAAAPGRLLVVADSRKMARGGLGTTWRRGVPVEVLPLAYVCVMSRLKEMGGTPVLRMGREKAGPVVTDNGGLVIDCDFGAIADPSVLAGAIKALPGVIDSGIFPEGMCERAYFGCEDGSVEEWGKQVLPAPGE